MFPFRVLRVWSLAATLLAEVFFLPLLFGRLFTAVFTVIKNLCEQGTCSWCMTNLLTKAEIVIHNSSFKLISINLRFKFNFNFLFS